MALITQLCLFVHNDNLALCSVHLQFCNMTKVPFPNLALYC